MSFELKNGGEGAEQSTVVGYRLFRIGHFLPLSIEYMETRRVLDPTGHRVTAAGKVGDLYTTLTVPSLKDRADIEGAELFWTDRTVLGTVSSVVGDVVTLKEGIVASPVGHDVQVQFRSCFGGPRAEHATLGRQWAIHLNPAVETDFQRMKEILFNIHYNLAAATLTKMGVAFDPAALSSAVQQMGKEGLHTDEFIVDQLEKVEKDRRAGTFTPSGVTGVAP